MNFALTGCLNKIKEKNAFVLDYGCGTGEIVKELHRAG